MSLEQARNEARKLVKAGKNPSHERQKEKQTVIEQQKAEPAAAANSFEAVVAPANGWSSSHARAILGTLERDTFPFIGDFRLMR